MLLSSILAGGRRPGAENRPAGAIRAQGGRPERQRQVSFSRGRRPIAGDSAQRPELKRPGFASAAEMVGPAGLEPATKRL